MNISKLTDTELEYVDDLIEHWKTERKQHATYNAASEGMDFLPRLVDEVRAERLRDAPRVKALEALCVEAGDKIHELLDQDNWPAESDRRVNLDDFQLGVRLKAAGRGAPIEEWQGETRPT